MVYTGIMGKDQTDNGLQVGLIADEVRLAYRPGTSDEKVMRHGFATADLSASRYQPERDHVILDIGAHIGTFALRLAKRVPDGRVIAVEASRETYEVLVHNVALNCAANVETDHLALAAQSGKADLYHYGENWGYTIMAPLDEAYECVEARSLEDYLNERHVDHCDLAKLNCEGAEFPILMAASRDTLARIERLLVLYHCDLSGGFELEDLERHLRNTGFHVRRIARSETEGLLLAGQKAQCWHEGDIG